MIYTMSHMNEWDMNDSQVYIWMSEILHDVTHEWVRLE